MKKKLALALLIAAAGLWFIRSQIGDWLYRIQQPALPPALERHELPAAATSTMAEPRAPRPASFNLKVPFTTQAPYANWDLPYQEACEEASLITVHHFWADQGFTPEVADAEILRLAAFENLALNSPDGFKDTDASTTAWIAERHWKQYRARVIYDWTIEQVETEIASGHPVVAFFAGKELGNPNFRNDGPLYHALVIKGYTANSFITNDVGTRRGADYVYKKEVLLNASHDWNNGDVAHGRRAALVLEPR